MSAAAALEFNLGVSIIAFLVERRVAFWSPFYPSKLTKEMLRRICEKYLKVQGQDDQSKSDFGTKHGATRRRIFLAGRALSMTAGFIILGRIDLSSSSGEIFLDSLDGEGVSVQALSLIVV